MNAQGLLVRLRAHRQYASSAERNIIDLIQKDPHGAVTLSIRALAAATYTSPSTVVRFCRKLGCSGYKEFQRELVYELASVDERSDLALEDIERDDVTERVVRKVAASNVRSIEATERLVDAACLDVCAAALHSARVVDLFGIGASLLVAHDFDLKLTRVGKECHVYDDWHSQLLCAKNMHADDIAVVISYSGLTAEMLECARVARGRGARVIAITRLGDDTPLAREADWALGVAASEPLLRSGAMASRMSQLTVVDMLYAVYVTKDYEHCTGLIRSNFIEKRRPHDADACKSKKGPNDD